MTWTITLPQADVDAHGAGYPITYAIPGATSARWRPTAQHLWQDIPPLPTDGRQDGVEGARLDAGTLYVSKAFPYGGNAWQLDAPGGTQVTAIDQYDNRDFALIITYDDMASIPDWIAALAVHRANRLWASVSLNPGWWNTADADAVAAASAAGYLELANHSHYHHDVALYPGDSLIRRSEVFRGRDVILSRGMPPQSRGRVHGYIYPHGRHDDTVFAALKEAGHIIGREVLSHTAAVSAGTYTLATDFPWGYVHRQMPSVTPVSGEIGSRVSTVDQQAAADKVKAAIQHALTNSLPMVMTYGYIRHYHWEPDAPWPLAMAEIGAMDNVWSVGMGHYALYHRTRSRLTIAAD